MSDPVPAHPGPAAEAAERPDYGHDLTPDLQRALRGRPSRSALQWVLDSTGTSSVVRVRALPGGRSSAVHRLTLRRPSGADLDVVLRRYVLDWVRDEPEAPPNEARVLALLEGTGVPAPRLVAADVDGSVTGTPTVLMSYVAGRVVWRPPDVDSWLQRLAQALLQIHAVAPATGLSPWAPYAPAEGLVPPPWTAHPRAWQRALELYAGPRPTGSTFLHRDFHPGNVLWSRHRVSGVVDWVSACVGPAEVDVAHCRYNLAVHGGDPAAADRFLALWQALTGARDYDPAFDLMTIVSVVPDDPDPALDAFCARAAAQLSG